MKYVFFDIECACVYKSVAKICAFGYVLTDENFNVLEREDILLNPKGKFHLTDRKGREGLVLPYVYEDFKKYPLFPAAYDRIKALLENKEHIVLGHATLNDVNYLNLETRRYKLPSLKFRYYDTQFFYMNVKKDFSRQLGLGAMAEELGVEFTPHRAVDDAYATMRVCEALIRRENADTVPAFVERYHIKGGSLEGKVFCFSKEVEEEVPMSVHLVAAIFASGGKYTSHPAECNVYIARGQGGVRYQNAMGAGAAFVPLERLESALLNV